MIPFNFLRLRKQAPDKGPPKAGLVDVAFNPATGKIGAIDADNNPVLFDGAGSLTISDGTTDAAAGELGEYKENGPAALTALTTDVAANRASISLTAGDWDVSGTIIFGFTGATGTTRGASISMVSAIAAADGISFVNTAPFTSLDAVEAHAVPSRRIKITSTTTVYIVASATFGSGSISASGQITARRVR